jgi:hypothetical protein
MLRVNNRSAKAGGLSGPVIRSADARCAGEAPRAQHLAGSIRRRRRIFSLFLSGDEGSSAQCCAFRASNAQRRRE